MSVDVAAKPVEALVEKAAPAQAAPEKMDEEPKKGIWSKCPGPSSAVWVAIGVLFGGGIGLIFSLTDESKSEDGAQAVTVLALPGKLWLKALKCIVLPMIVFSMIEAMVMMRALPGSRKVGVAVVGVYVLTTVTAALEGCIFSAIVMGGTVEKIGSTDKVAPSITERTTLDTILSIAENLVPGNLVNDAAKNNLLPVIIASIIFGLLIDAKKEDGTKSNALTLIAELNKVVVRVVTGIMALTPLGVASLVLASTARLDIESMGVNVGYLVLAVVVGLAAHFLVFYPVLLVGLARRNPLVYYKNLLPAFATALGTSSSAATLPLSRTCALKNGIARHTANFVLSLGATINMDGTSIYLINACYFLGRVQGVEFDVGDFILMALLATLCSMGAAPVPSASLVLLATIMTAVNVPFNETFGIISAVDWMLDRLRTTVNVAGDATVAAVIHANFEVAAGDVEDGEASKGNVSKPQDLSI